VRLEEPLAAVEALDAGEVALEDRRVEDLVVVDPAEEAEELLGGGGGELVGDVVRIEPPRAPPDRDVVDGRASGGDRRASTERERERRRETEPDRKQ
jgi:hypothetical protein